MKFFIFLLSIFLIYSCTTEKKPKAICDSINLEYRANNDAKIYIIGDFNNWELTTPMNYDTKWKISLNLNEGNHAYLFYSKKDKKRYFDPDNQLTIYKDGIKASRLIVENCRYPKLSLSNININNDSYALEVKYNGVNEIDLKNSEIYLNGKITQDFLYKDNIFYISKKNLSVGKYSYLFKVKDKEGRASNSFFIPIWIENLTLSEPQGSFEWKDAVIYQILTDRFKNGDLNNDNPIPDIDKKANWQGGDYKGITEKINDNYFTDLGINTIWVSSPILNTEKAGKGMGGDERYYAPYHSYWPIATGYNDHNKLGIFSPLEAHFGTDKELKNMINKAHEKGIRVLFDVIPNHVHTDSYMWQKYNNIDWFHLEENGSPFICGWHRPIVCWFNRYLADINHKNVNASSFVIDHLIWLAKEYNIDGFRVDAVRLMITEFTETLNYFIKKELETTGIKFYTIGENFTAEVENDVAFDVIGKYLGKNRLMGLFNFPLFHELSRTFFLQNETLIDFEAYLTKNINKFQKDYYENALMGNFLGNHDLARAISVANGDFDENETNGGYLANAKVWENEVTTPTNENTYKKLTMAQTIAFTLPDIPIIYQGDEYGLPGANDPDNRRMMIFNNELSNLQKNTLENFKKISNLRKEHPSTKSKEFTTLLLTETLWAYTKISRTDGSCAHPIDNLPNEIIPPEEHPSEINDFIITIINTGTEKDITLPLENLNLQNNTYLFNIFNQDSYLIENNNIKLRIKQMESIILTLQ